LKEDKSNLVDWFVAMKVSLHVRLDGLWPNVIQTDVTEVDDLKAWHIIREYVAPCIREEIAWIHDEPGCTLKTLNVIYGTEDRYIAQQSFNHKLSCLKLQNFTDPLKFYHAAIRLDNSARLLRIQGITSGSENDIAKAFILGLGSEWKNTFHLYWRSHDDFENPFKLSDIKIMLVNELETTKTMQLARNDRRPAAFTATSDAPPPGYSIDQGTQIQAFLFSKDQTPVLLGASSNTTSKKKNNFKPKQKKHCTHCDKPNHLEFECWQKFPEKKKAFLGKRTVTDNNETSATTMMETGPCCAYSTRTIQSNIKA
jgi:hypothetical protein